MLPSARAAFLAATIVLIETPQTFAQDFPEAKVCLVLAIDVSGSVTSERFALQMEGYAIAFTDVRVQTALATTGTVAVRFVQWAGLQEQRSSAWFFITDEESAFTVATYIATAPRNPTDGGTYLGDALAYSLNMLVDAPYDCKRKVIDISGDGDGRAAEGPTAYNSRPVATAKAQAVLRNIIINGLPLLGNEETIVQYYHDEVIVGEGSFIEVVEDPDDIDSFTNALIRKLLKEIRSS